MSPGRHARALLAAASICAACATPARRDAPPPPKQTTAAWCGRVEGGAPGTRETALDLSAAHAGIRFFGVEGDPGAVDSALADALATPGDLQPEAILPAYVAAMKGPCVAQATRRPEWPATVRLVGDVAFVSPGTGAVELPDAARAAVIDLRSLPGGADWQMLEAAVAPALATPIPRARRSVRARRGMDDEVMQFLSAGHYSIYSNAVRSVDAEQIPATGKRDLPIVLLTGPTMSPEAAELAGTLRLARRARIVGEDVLAAVAESEWTGVGSLGIAWRASDLLTTAAGGETRWPDVIPADRGGGPHLLAEDLATPDPVAVGEDRRPRLEPLPNDQPNRAREIGRGELRASLIIAHGALRLWFPYFQVVGDRIDERLLETLVQADRLPQVFSREAAMELLLRFGEAIQDGHCMVWDTGVPSGDRRVLPIVVDAVGDTVLVQGSAVPGVNAGDTIIEVDGEPVDAYFRRVLPMTPGATPGFRYDRAARGLLYRKDPTDVMLRDPRGFRRKVTVAPVAASDATFTALLAHQRPSGFLTSLGAPTTYYLNLDARVLTEDDALRDQIRAAGGATGLIVDMRGYPQISPAKAAQRLIRQPFDSFAIGVLRRDGPRALRLEQSQRRLEPLHDAWFDGPIVLLVGPHTGSAAETFAMLLVGANRVTVVGRQSAASNGSTTGLVLPGGLTFTFTGSEIRFPDGATFHGVGIRPHVTVTPTADDYAAGRDPELLAAIKLQALAIAPGRLPSPRLCPSLL